MRSYDKLLQEAAARHLQAIGGAQKGKSRLWLVDCAWYVAVVEFQPSSWSKGACLNVGAHFLWRATDHLTFDFGYRKEGHAEFVDDAQFAQAADVLACRAAQEVGILRAKLDHPASLQTITPRNSGEPWIDAYHRGVSFALAGQSGSAAAIFQALLAATPGDAKEYGRLLALVFDRQAFEEAMFDLIAARRTALKLPVLTASPW